MPGDEKTNIKKEGSLKEKSKVKKGVKSGI